MFDAITRSTEIPAGRIGAGLALAIGLHAGAMAAIVCCPGRHRIEAPKATEVAFRTALAPAPLPPPPPPPASGASEPEVVQAKRPTRVKTREALAEPKEKEPEKPGESVAAQPSAAPGGDAIQGAPGGVDGGVQGGVAGGGVPGGEPGGTGTGTATATRSYVTLQFGSGMVQPTLVGGSAQPVIPREASIAKVSGKIIARCTITEAGTLVDCHLIKSLPFMDEAVLANLASRRYTPVLYEGHPQRVYFTFYITVKAD